MSAERETPALTGFVCKLRGGSQPILAEASDGLRYVVKFRNQPQGPNLLFNEGTGTELYRLANLLVPAWSPLQVTQRFIDENRGCWIETEYGLEPPDAGLCFGSCYLGGGGIRLYELLPGTHFPQVRNRGDFWLAWLLDACSNHADHRQVVFCRGFDCKYSAAFVDHGHMFGGPNGEQTLPFATSAYLDRRVYPDFSPRQAKVLATQVLSMDCERVWRHAQALPENWRNPTAFARLAEGLNRLSCCSSVEDVLNALFTQQSSADLSKRHDNPERKPIASVLRLGVQGAASRGCAVV